MGDGRRFWEWVNELRAAESVYREAGTEAALARLVYAEAGLRDELRRLRDNCTRSARTGWSFGELGIAGTQDLVRPARTAMAGRTSRARTGVDGASRLSMSRERPRGWLGLRRPW